MLKKRLAGVITVKGDIAVQSFGFKQYLPVGSPVIVAEYLQRHGVDEIIVLDIDRSKQSLGPNLELIRTIAASGLATPLAYGGGIACANDALSVINAGAERIVVDAAMQGPKERLEDIMDVIGTQALIGSIPLCIQDSNILWFNYMRNECHPVTEQINDMLKSGIFSEFLIIDSLNEGSMSGFDLRILEMFEGCGSSLIAFGGLGGLEIFREVLRMPSISAIAIGNSLHYREHSVYNLKKELRSSDLRAQHFEDLTLKPRLQYINSAFRDTPHG